MKNILLLITAVLIFSQCSKKTAVPAVSTQGPDKTWRKMSPTPAPARDIQLGTYSDFKLANGLHVIVVENHKLPRVSYQLSLNNEAIVEGDKAGYTSFAGELLNKGTKTRSKAQIDEAIDFIGASLSTSATGIFGSSLKKHAGKLLDVMSDVLYNPVFPQDEFEKVRKRTASGLASSKTNPDAIAGNIRSVVNFDSKHPYGEVQTEETIKNITLDDCKNYYNTFFRPNNAYLVIVGDITTEEARMQAEKYFGKWEKKDVPQFDYTFPQTPKGSQVRFGNKDGAVQSVISITYPVDMKPGSPDAIKTSVMNTILGGGIFSGRLMQNLREKKAYTYGARSSISNDRLAGTFNATASVRNEVTDSAVTEFIYEMNRIASEPVTDKDLSLAKSSLTGNFGRSLESPQTIANFALNTFRYDLPKDYYNNYLKNLDAVTIDDVNYMARKYVHANNCNIVVVGSKEAVADKLKKFDSDGKIDFYDPFGKKLEDKKVEMSSSVTAESVIADYLEAIGGKDKLKGIKTLTSRAKSDLGGMQASFENYQTASGKFAMKVIVNNMTMQEQRFDGAKGASYQMGAKKEITDAKQLDGLKKQAVMFDQLQYSNQGYKLELKGIEDVDGASCYKVNVLDPEGDTSTEFYDVKSGLLVRVVKTQEAMGQKATITTDMADYREVDGVRLPYKTSINGAAPMTIVLEMESIEVNKPLGEEIFKVD